MDAGIQRSKNLLVIPDNSTQLSSVTGDRYSRRPFKTHHDTSITTQGIRSQSFDCYLRIRKAELDVCTNQFDSSTNARFASINPEAQTEVVSNPQTIAMP